jgi:hypothetical protein
VVLVAELNRLIDEVGLIGVVAGPIQRRESSSERAAENQERDDADPRVNVGVAMEDLAHRVDAMVAEPPRAYSKLPAFRRGTTLERPLSSGHEGAPTIHCVNDDQRLVYTMSPDAMPAMTDDNGEAACLYEPNASIMKAGCFGELTTRYPVKAIAIDSHLFVSDEEIADFPGRRFAITAITTMNKKELARSLRGITRANVATRNFPMTAQQLRQRLHLADGGDTYIFASTAADGGHQLFICRKIG